MPVSKQPQLNGASLVRNRLAAELPGVGEFSLPVDRYEASHRSGRPRPGAGPACPAPAAPLPLSPPALGTPLPCRRYARTQATATFVSRVTALREGLTVKTSLLIKAFTNYNIQSNKSKLSCENTMFLYSKKV